METVFDLSRELREHHVLQKGHFVFTGGQHSDTYFNKAIIFTDTELTSRICRIIAEHFKDTAVEVVLAPAVGGVALSQWIAHHLSQLTGRKVLSLYADKATKPGSWLWLISHRLRWLFGKWVPQFGRAPATRFYMARGYKTMIAGKNVLVVEDTLSTGKSACQVVERARAHGGNVVGVGAVCNRGNVTVANVGNPPKLFSVLNLQLDAWPAEECELCKQGVPIDTELGQGKNQ